MSLKMELNLDYEIYDDIAADDSSWKEWRHIVETERWTSDDCSVLTLTPLLSTTRTVVAKNKKDSKYIGSVVWNEYDNIAFLGFYILLPEYRGKGIGSILWQRAMSRMKHCSTMGLRAVPDMKEKYQQVDTPIEGSNLITYDVTLDTLIGLIQKYGSKSNNENDIIRHVADLSEEEYTKMLEFDKEVVGRDRSEFIRLFHNLPFTDGSVLFDSNGNVKSIAAITPTLTPISHLYKLSPIYADNTSDAIHVMQPLINKLSKQDPEARVLFHLLSDSIGADELVPMLESIGIPPHISGYTLFTKPYSNSINIRRVFIPHNNSGHFDA